MLDCWKNSCHGATVVPTMAMMSSTDVELAPPAIPGTNRPCSDGAGLGMAEDGQRNDQEVRHDEEEHEAFPAPEAARGRDGHQAQGGGGDGDVLAHPEIAEGQVHADELGDDGEEIEDQ